MGVDATVALAVAALAALGWWRGFLGQVLGWAGLVVAWFATPALAPWIRPVLSGRGFTAGSVAVASALLAFSVVLLVFRIAQAKLPDAVGEWSLSAKRVDSGLGAVLGGLRGLALMWIVLAAFVLVEGPLLEREPALRPHWQESHAVAFTRTYNPVAEMSLRRLAALQRVLADRADDATGTPSADPEALEPPEAAGTGRDAKRARDAGRDTGAAPARAAEAARRSRAASGEIDDDAVERVPRPGSVRKLRDPALREAARRKDWGALLADERVERLLQDDQALEHALRTLRSGPPRPSRR